VQDRDLLEAAILAAGPSIDGLCYAAGTINLKPFARLTDADAFKDFEINALGAFRAVQIALPQLKASPQKTASVLLFSTISVQQGFAAHASVAMAKGAVEGLTRSLAAELAPKIRVNAIAPSLTKTPLASFLTQSEPTAQAIAGLHPLQRLGEADDIAAMAALLLGPGDRRRWRAIHVAHQRLICVALPNPICPPKPVPPAASRFLGVRSGKRFGMM
jgi:NAD(P)-dependent dehydrogenase (short-subunit alcohol dehydrogenase family)